MIKARWLPPSCVAEPGYYFQSFVDAPYSRGVVRWAWNAKKTELEMATSAEPLPLSLSSKRALYWGPLPEPPPTPFEFNSREKALRQ